MAESKNHSSSNGHRSTSSSPAGSGSSYSIADEIFGRKDSKPSARSSSGYFSSFFPSTSSVKGNDLAHSDLYWTLNENRTDGQAANNAHNLVSGNKSQGSPTKRQAAYNKDGKLVYPNEPMESTYFGSSVHYGGRDFYPSSSSLQSSETPKNYKNDKNDDYDNGNAATRGEWWQGSLYY